MPLGGGSSWAHTHDSYFLLRADGSRWGILSTSVQRTDAQLYLERCAVFALETASIERDAAVAWTYHHPGLPQGYLRRRWRPETPAAELVPHPEIGDGPVEARLESTLGAITVTDGEGVARVHLRLGAADPAWPADAPRIELLRSGQPVVALCLPIGPNARVEWHATSMP